MASNRRANQSMIPRVSEFVFCLTCLWSDVRTFEFLKARSLAFLLLLLLLVFASPSARAQAFGEEEEEAPVQQQPGMFLMNDVQLDSWIFNGAGTSAAARTRLGSQLTLQVEDIGRRCALTDPQRQKLLVAGHGDIKKFFDRVEAAKRKFEGVKNDQNKFNEIWQDIQPIQTAYTLGVFNDGSLFSKTLKKALDTDQLAKNEAAERERTLYRYHARLDLAVEMLNSSVGFSTDQRNRLLKLIDNEVRPPKRMGQNDYYAVLYLISRIPESKIKPIFNDHQWKMLDRSLTQAKGFEQWIKQSGFVPDDAPATKTADSKPMKG
jgi:hypothetical protein